MEIPNILSEEEKQRLKMLARKSSSNIKDAIVYEVARVENKINTEDGIEPKEVDEDLEL